MSFNVDVLAHPPFRLINVLLMEPDGNTFLSSSIRITLLQESTLEPSMDHFHGVLNYGNPGNTKDSREGSEHKHHKDTIFFMS